MAKAANQNIQKGFKVREGSDYTMVCLPVRVDNLQALVSGLSPIQVDKLRYNCLVPPLSVKILSVAQYFVLKLTFSGKGGMMPYYTGTG